ncbi:hypothetical protein SAMN05661003_12310 [Desulfuromonas thiophila]|uniref:ABC-type transport system involved in multi-copper enzyme maturation, permease component n=1 Tax=Desulfuromonas thiophila TaxID=57664 RepID=A0A1G7ESN9_9BACT|nr:hypothetical protein SAMN05661003_12310 [Desulfuromonas thiophila]
MINFIRLSWLFNVGLIRDKVLRVIFLAGLFFLLLAPFISVFSLRQVQQLLVTTTLGWLSLTLLLLALILGGGGVWRDIERRWLFALLGLPLRRSTYLLARALSLVLCLSLTALFLGAVGAALIAVMGDQYSTAHVFSWAAYWCAVFFALLRYVLLALMALMLSCVSTSFFLPLFGSLAVFLAGSASQNVMDYLAGLPAENVSPLAKLLVQTLYVLLPNFSALDFTTQAVYGLEIKAVDMAWGLGYFTLYTAVVLALAVWCLERRELK